LRETPQQPPTSPTPIPKDTNFTTERTNVNSTFDYADAFADAFSEEMVAYNATTAPTRNKSHLSPTRTTLNPYTKKQNLFSFSRDFTSKEIDEIDNITHIETLQQENQRLTLLDSLREKIHTTYSHTFATNNPQTPTTNNPSTVLQSVTCNTTRNYDAISTLTAMDDSTPSSRPSVTFHPSLISSSHTTVLQKQHTAILKCFIEAQNKYISVQNSILVEAHLTHIAAHQRTEQTAEATALILQSETTTPT
jgi:hypothetical protein